MNLEEYKQQMEEDNFSPGWDAIDASFSEVYGTQEPAHFGTNLVARAIFGGDEYIDGYSIYTSDKGYKHIVTFGLSELYGNEEAFGGEYSKWGYELTIKLPEEDNEECMWAIDMLSNLARYTNQSKAWFNPFDYVAGNGESIRIGYPSKITALIIVPDTEIHGKQTVHGRLDFMQVVGITENELQAIKGKSLEEREAFVRKMQKDNPELITDMKREKEYLE